MVDSVRLGLSHAYDAPTTPLSWRPIDTPGCNVVQAQLLTATEDGVRLDAWRSVSLVITTPDIMFCIALLSTLSPFYQCSTDSVNKHHRREMGTAGRLVLKKFQ